MREEVILVNAHDEQIGVAEKLDAHKKGVLHRAFSILVFNSNGEMMLQQRAKTKYHCGGLWSNACCGHPRPGETVEQAAKRRLMEEMGFVSELKEIFNFTYNIEFENGLVEHEFLHVLKGIFDEVPKLNPNEADDWKWIGVDELKQDIKVKPEEYTYWFKEIIKKLR